MRDRTLLVFVVAGTALAWPAAAGPKSVDFRNDTTSAIVQLQARETGTRAWPGDVIKQIPLGVQKIRAVSLTNGAACKYDLFITFDDGRQVIQQAVDVCAKAPVSIKPATE